MVELNNAEILEGLKTKNKDVIRYLYEVSYDQVMKMIIRKNGSEEDAQDVFQESIMVLFMKVREPNFDLGCTCSTYLFGIAKNKWLNRIRHKKVQAQVSLEPDFIIDDDFEEEEILLQHEKWKLYKEEFDKLSEACQKLLKLFMENTSMKNIAKIMGYSSEQHAKNRRYRCQKSLISNITSNPKFKKLKNEEFDFNTEIS